MVLLYKRSNYLCIKNSVFNVMNFMSWYKGVCCTDNQWVGCAHSVIRSWYVLSTIFVPVGSRSQTGLQQTCGKE